MSTLERGEQQESVGLNLRQVCCTARPSDAQKGHKEPSRSRSKPTFRRTKKKALNKRRKNNKNFPTRQLLLGEACEGGETINRCFYHQQPLTGSSHSSGSRSIKRRRAGRWCSADPPLLLNLRATPSCVNANTRWAQR